MKVVIQRVKKTKLLINNETFSSIDKGILVLLGFKSNDKSNIFEKMINKILNLRIFNDQDGKMNLSVKDIEGQIMIVSNFTLYANSEKGLRPSYTDSMNSNEAEILYNQFIEQLNKAYPDKVATGQFGADMQIELINDGPVTIIYEI